MKYYCNLLEVCRTKNDNNALIIIPDNFQRIQKDYSKINILFQDKKEEEEEQLRLIL